MGGYGSGKFSLKRSTDQAMRLDFRPWFRRGHHRDPERWWSPSSWTVRGEVVAEIAVEFDPAEPDQFVLTYERNGVPVRDRVPIVTTPTRGAATGDRPWVACPGCRRRCAVLWGVDGWWRCRRCHGLRYGVEGEDPFDRACRAVEVIRRRLGCDLAREVGTVFERERPRRPARMPRATYRRLLSQLARAEDRAHAAYVDELRRMVAALGG